MYRISRQFMCYDQYNTHYLSTSMEDIHHCKVAVVGNVDSGKSTLVGVLTKAQPDDGNGSARKLVFNYDHEKETGRTSSVCYEIMGFDQTGKQVIPERLDTNRNRYWD
jgi:GTPase